MKIGNILYEKELVNHERVDYINYHQFSGNTEVNLSEIDRSLPTLIVGWKFLKKHYPDLNVNILTHKIINNELYWEFSFDENKSSHVSGVKNFVENVPNFYFTPQYRYRNLDPVFYRISNNQELFDILPKNIDAVYKFKDRMVYILDDDMIYGIDLEMYNFFKFNVQGMMDKICDLTTGPCIDDPEAEQHKKYYKIFPEFSYLKRYLVVIMSK